VPGVEVLAMRAAAADVVVVGGGASGAVVARRLADDAEISVVLVEAGPTDEGRQDILDLRNWFALLGDKAISVPYPIEQQPHANSALVHSRARVLGGCSSHNAGIALRAPDADLERWAVVAGPGWGPDGTAAAWERVFATVAVTPASSRNPLAVAVVQAGQEVGLPLIEAWGREVPAGIGWVPLNARGGRRCSSSVAYLHPLDALPSNLTILTNTPVERVLLDDSGAATGVLTARGRISARQEVILCAGAFETPKLLMLSGIGARDELAPHGVPVRIELPGVGAHLVDHPETIVTWQAARQVPDEGEQFWEVVLLAETGRGLTMVHVGTKPAVPRGYPQPAHGLSITPNAAHPQSEGVVRLRSAGPTDLPRVDPRYLTDPAGDDLAVLVEGIRLARAVAAAPALSPWLADEVAPGDAISSRGELEHYVRTTLATVHHPAGTARMGDAEDDGAVVDPRLRVRGVRRLRVADASVFPSLTCVNPCLTCMMVAERAAELVRGELRETHTVHAPA
jgi:choline oxidase